MSIARRIAELEASCSSFERQLLEDFCPRLVALGRHGIGALASISDLSRGVLDRLRSALEEVRAGLDYSLNQHSIIWAANMAAFRRATAALEAND